MDNGTSEHPDEILDWIATYTGYIYVKVSGENYSRFNFLYKQVPSFVISTSRNPTAGGTVGGGGTYFEEEICTVEATPSNGYTFVNWTEGSATVSTNSRYTFTVTDSKTLVANFKVNTLTIEYAVGGGSGSKVPTTHNYNASISFPSNPFTRTGYDFTGWAISGAGSGIWTSGSKTTDELTNINSISTGSRSIILTAQWKVASGAPANDLCANATNLPCGTTNQSGTTVGATAKTGTVASNTSPYGVWYTFTGDGNSTTITTTPSSGFNHAMGIYTGSCGSLTHVVTKNAAGSGSAETHTFTTTSGTRYYVYVAYYGNSGNSTQTGTFTISRTCTNTYSWLTIATLEVTPAGTVRVVGPDSASFTKLYVDNVERSSWTITSGKEYSLKATSPTGAKIQMKVKF